ncbi:hypothetical protein GCK72_002708 [Caenorhabditis remanei]|uniref:Uncharacterized protein n=1 Tax=Caenorhabditis remanei TaxID=31234 RepID=A0A6A5HVW5_CAERE|nr:hypothetical protein GCK72_002708 [Caenorhabditis remanei]KAF1770884.1 hypothetical protein GCK72_002708 [Caenorhabditis remanei]
MSSRLASSKGKGRNIFKLEIDPKILEIPSDGYLTVHIKNDSIRIAGIVVELKSSMFRIANPYAEDDSTTAYTRLDCGKTIDLVIAPRASLIVGNYTCAPEGTLTIYHYDYPPTDEKTIYACNNGSNAWESPHEFPFLWTKKYDKDHGEIEMDLVLPFAEGHVKKMRNKHLKDKKRHEKQMRKEEKRGHGKGGCTIV